MAFGCLPPRLLNFDRLPHGGLNTTVAESAPLQPVS
jgi:hypothetical protein